jgi:diaminohydroxyphosphoribosylaminopyrimidine deaminase/5-amino-6-(5-phosphoribosylamino)uracil reductase
MTNNRRTTQNNKSTSISEKYMQQAIELARKGLGYVSPNPMVGAVIVKDNRIIGSGYHARFGGDHAEVAAIKSASEDVTGATMYVTLEPCCFHGKTPPCVNLIIESKIKHVVIGTVDPDPRVNQKGIQILRENGIDVSFSSLEDESKQLIEAYSFHRQNCIPFTTIKIAQTLDGQIATRAGHSQWISSPASQTYAHQLRKEHDAVMVGTGTVLKDNPQLNLRHVQGINPKRIILDSKLRIPLESKIFRLEDIEKTVIVSSESAPQKKLEQLKQIGVETIKIQLTPNGYLNLKQLWEVLGRKGMTSVLVEGGSQLITSLLKNQQANRFIAAIAPLILGQGTSAIGNLDKQSIDDAIRLKNIQKKFIGNDSIIIGDLEYH